MTPVGRSTRLAALLVGLALVLAGCGIGTGPRQSVRGPAPRAAGTSTTAPAGGAPSLTSSSGPSAGQRASPDWVRAENAEPGTSAWRLTPTTTANDRQLSGFASTVSVAPGGSFGLFIDSRLGPVTVTAYRLGWYGGMNARQVWRSGPVTTGTQPACTVAAGRMVTCHWHRSLTVTAADWPPGSYLLELTAGELGHYIPLTVRSTRFAGRLVLVSETTTYAAYNLWGGHSLYKNAAGDYSGRSYRVSYNRPYDGNGATQLLAFELGPIKQAEKLGLPLAYTTSWDINQHPRSLIGAAGVVSLGHDEYWSVPMRKAFTAARDHGSNIAFLGANAVYRRIRFAQHGRIVVDYKNAALDPVKNSPDTTALWREDPDPDPENSLTGMLYECFPAVGPFTVSDPSFFLFRGSGATTGSTYAGLAGHEIDRAYPIAGTPQDLQVVAHSPQRCGQTKQTYSDMTYYTTSSGAGVVDTGTMLWATALRGTDTAHGTDARTVAFARTVTDNLFRAMLAGPMGQTHPSRPNLASLHASASTATGTGGPVAH